MTTLVYPYSSASQSAKELAAALKGKRALREGGLLSPDVLINWGCSAIRREIAEDTVIFNLPEAVKHAANKLHTLRILKDAGVSVPDFTTSLAEASRWLAEGFTVVARAVLNGHSGEGITIHSGNDVLPEVPLYTKYVNKKQEYRLHATAGSTFFLQRKARKKDVPDAEVNWKVRNLKGGFIFANQDVEVDVEAHDMAHAAVFALNLDFGACDIIWDGKKYYVLEVNTACGLAGTTIERYVQMFNRQIGAIKGHVDLDKQPIAQAKEW